MLRTLACSLAFSVCLTGCGGDASKAGGAGACDVSGCGGDIEGTWAVTSMCGHPTAPIMTGVSACDESTKESAKTTRFVPMGLQVVFSDTGYTQSGNVKKEYTYVYTDACLGAQSGLAASVETCAEVETNLNGAGQAGTCKLRADTCVCHLSEVGPMSASGAYSVEGTDLVMGGTKTPFCVHGDEAELAAVTSSFSGRMSLELR